MSSNVSPVDTVVAAKIIEEGIKAAADYAIAREQEMTERQRINAWLRALTNLIETQGKLFEMHMEIRFKERSERYAMLDRWISIAIEQGDDVRAQYLLEYMIRIYEHDPTGVMEQLGQSTGDITKKYLGS